MADKVTDKQDSRKPVYGLMLRFLTAVGQVRGDERRDTLCAFLTLLGFMAGHALLETARDALFLAELPVSLLPWAYLTIAAIALLLFRYQSRLVAYLRLGQELGGWLILSGCITLLFWAAIPFVGDWIFYALYTWSGVLATLVVVRFWTILSDRFTVTQAKRLFAVVGSGSVIGAILGSGLARVLTEVVAARQVVLTAGVVFLISALAPILLGGPVSGSGGGARPADASAVEVRRVAGVVLRQPYLRQVAAAILLATITFTLVDFVFKSTVARVIPDDSLGEFFSSVYFSFNLVSLLVQLVAVSWILRRVGVSMAVAIVPALLLAGAIGFIASVSLIAALALKSADGALRYSLYRTTTELLFVPMSTEIRGRVKAFIDVLGQRGGQAIGSLIVLLLLTLTTNEVVFAIAAALTAGAWLLMAVALKRHYLGVFRKTLSEDITATRIEFPALDVASLETLLTTLSSPDDRRVAAALDLLAEQGKINVVPALILYHPSPAVVAQALEHFVEARRADAIPVIDRLMAHSEQRIRVAALRARTALLPDEASLRSALEDASPGMRVTALVGLAAGGWLPAEQAQSELDAALSAGARDTMLAATHAIRSLPTPGFDALLHTLVAIPDPEVQLEAIRAIRSLKDPSFTMALMPLLAQRSLRAEVRATLVTLGPTALGRLAAAFSDRTLAHAVRRHLPRTISAFATAQASTVLLRQLLAETDGMIRFKILRALGRMRTESPRLPLDERTIRAAIEQNLTSAFRYMRWRHALEHGARRQPRRATGIQAMLVGLLKDKQAHATERLFRLVNLLANDEEYLRIYRGLGSSRREARAGSRELVENLLQPPLRRPMLTLIDDLFETVVSADDTEEGENVSYQAVLAELVQSGLESLSCLAAAHAGELAMTSTLDTLTRLPALSPAHAEVLHDAIGRLRAQTAGGGA